MSFPLPPELLELPVGSFAVEVRLPGGAPRWLGSAVRGGIGTASRELACTREPEQECEACPDRATCLHALLFAPVGPADGPARPPSPWRTEVHPRGDRLRVRLLTFGLRAGELVEHAERATRRALMMGDVDGVPADLPRTVQPRAVAPLAARLAPLPDAGPVVLRLLSPVSLKVGGRFLDGPASAAFLVGAIARRARLLVRTHGTPPNGDDAAWRPAVEDPPPDVPRVRRTVRWRRSDRQDGRAIPLPGVVGELGWDALGPTTLAWFRVAEVLGIGRNTSMGLGAVRLGRPRRARVGEAEVPSWRA